MRHSHTCMTQDTPCDERNNNAHLCLMLSIFIDSSNPPHPAPPHTAQAMQSPRRCAMAHRNGDWLPRVLFLQEARWVHGIVGAEAVRLWQAADKSVIRGVIHGWLNGYVDSD